MTEFFLTAIIFIALFCVLKWKDRVEFQLKENTQQLNQLKETKKLEANLYDKRH